MKKNDHVLVHCMKYELVLQHGRDLENTLRVGIRGP